MITTILWDVDGTLLDFLAAEKAAIRTLLQNSGSGNARMRRSPVFQNQPQILGKAGKRRADKAGSPGRQIPGIF